MDDGRTDVSKIDEESEIKLGATDEETRLLVSSVDVAETVAEVDVTSGVYL